MDLCTRTIRVYFLVRLIIGTLGLHWHEFAGHCYAVFDVNSNFNTSKSFCERIEMYMVEIEDDQELYYLQTIIKWSNKKFWVGLEFDNATRKFYWNRDGNEPQTSMWLPNEPNFSGRCVELATQGERGSDSALTFLLGDQSCNSSNNVICERNADMLEDMPYLEVKTYSGHTCPILTVLVRYTQCAQNCSKNKFCTGFQYNKTTQTCTPYKFDVNCATPQIMPLTLYVRELPRC